MGKPPPTSANASAHKIAAQIGGQVERALPKANGLPLYVFVELNLAPEIAEGLAPLIVDELESILPQIDTGCDANGKFVGRAMNLLTASNWAVHLGEAKHKGGETLNIFTSPRLADCRYPLDSVYADRVKIALTHYGTVADL
jgi:hypothetical protein